MRFTVLRRNGVMLCQNISYLKKRIKKGEKTDLPEDIKILSATEIVDRYLVVYLERVRY